MKVAVVTFLFAEGNVEVDTCHQLHLKDMRCCKGRIYWSLAGFMFLTVWLCCVSTATRSQQPYTMQLFAVDSSARIELGDSVKTLVFKDPTEVFQMFREKIQDLQRRGFLAASFDSTSETERQYQAWLYVGHKYSWAKVCWNHVSPAALAQTGFRKEQWTGRPLRPMQVSRLCDKLLNWAEDNGFPFATAGLLVDSMVESGGIYARFYLNEGPFTRLDSIRFQTNVRISPDFLYRQLDILPGMPYNEAKLKQTSSRIRELPFLRESAPPLLSFKPGETKVQFFLREKKSNQLNALVGLLPNNVETGKFLLTVDAHLRFHNLLTQGEMIDVSYQNLQYKSPRLVAALMYPFLFRSPVGLDISFNLFKKDTTFRRAQLQAGIRYRVSGASSLRFFYHNQSNRLITVDTHFVRRSKTLPDNVDVMAQGLGGALTLFRTDDRLNPHRGYELDMSGTVLNRALSRNQAIDGMTDASGFRYSSLYDTLVRQRYQYQVRGYAAAYFPLHKKLVLKAAYEGGWISGSRLFRNELFQIGGSKLLRGFDEQSIFTNQFHVAVIECRVMLGGMSYFSLFSDNGYIVSAFGQSRRSGWYNGFGLGASLETRNGQFTISYALGRNPENPVRFRQSRVHIGYNTLF